MAERVPLYPVDSSRKYRRRTMRDISVLAREAKRAERNFPEFGDYKKEEEEEGYVKEEERSRFLRCTPIDYTSSSYFFLRLILFCLTFLYKRQGNPAE